MKKRLSLLLALALMLALLVGCGREKNSQSQEQTDPQAVETDPHDAGAAADETQAPDAATTEGDNSVSFDDAQQQTQGDNSVSIGGDTAPAGESETAPTESVTGAGEFSPPV